jgi:hypothetical protein
LGSSVIVDEASLVAGMSRIDGQVTAEVQVVFAVGVCLGGQVYDPGIKEDESLGGNLAGSE